MPGSAVAGGKDSRKTLLQRFLEKTEADPATEGCRHWQGSTSGGYGHIRVARKLRLATHVAVELATGKAVPPGSWVRPTCGTPSCVAFGHLTVEAPHGAGGQRKKKSPGSRFSAKIVFGPTTDCHLWTGARDAHGYGLFHLGGRQMGAHRAAYILASGQPIPAGMSIRHDCDQPLCVNPAHLRCGTAAEDRQDRVNRGRQERGFTLQPELQAKDRDAMLATKEAGFSFQEIVAGWAMSPAGVTQALAKARQERAAAEQAKAA